MYSDTTIFLVYYFNHWLLVSDGIGYHQATIYRGADKSLARANSRSILFDGQNIYIKVKYPATGRGDPRGSEQVKASDHHDFRHYKGGSSSAKRTGRLYPRRNPWYSFSEAESTSGHMVLKEGTTKKIPSDTTGIDPGTFRLAAQRLNYYATPGPIYIYIYIYIYTHTHTSEIINIPSLAQ